MKSLSAARAKALRNAFDGLLADADAGRFLQRDPVVFVRRYAEPKDREIAGAVASALAFGKVDLFFPVLTKLFAEADARGGPHTYATSFTKKDAKRLAPLYYRWNRGNDFALWFATLGRAVREYGSLAALFTLPLRRFAPPPPPMEGDEEKASTSSSEGQGEARLEHAITALEAIAAKEAQRLGLEVTRSFKTFLARPSSGSACKRWNMFLRWMVRPDDGIDLGVWSLPASSLVLPLDTHTHRISQYVGLTTRKQANWRTAVEITAALRQLDAVDPVRFDFALAHLGISGGCRRRYRAEICSTCALLPVCRFAQLRTPP
jgi:uncharacterized protein (TIGR02757 family)